MRPIDADLLVLSDMEIVMCDGDYKEALKMLIDKIEHVPTIEPERKKGHWIRHPEQRNIFNGKTIECSECHEKYRVQYVEDELFCRHCGADMREPEDIPMEYFESGGRRKNDQQRERDRVD